MTPLGDDIREVREPQRKLASALKQPPHSMESEMSLLGDLMTRPQVFFTASATVSEDDFYRIDHRTIWRCIAKLAKAGKATDMVTVAEALRDTDELEKVGGMAYLGELAVDAIGHADNHAIRVRELAQRRRVLTFAAELSEAAYSQNSEDLLGAVTVSLDALLRTGAAKSIRFTDMAQSAIEVFTQAKRTRQSGKSIGAATGLALFDRVSGTFHGPRLIIIAARPKCGKTALLNQFAINAAVTGKPGLVCSLEMGANEIAARALALHSGANVSKIQRGEDEDLRLASASVGKLGDLPLYFDFETFNLDAIVSQIALHKYRHGIQWAAVDHIGLVKTTGRFGSRNDQMGHISWTLKQLAKRLDMPVIALSQLSRSCDTERRRPRADDLRDSGNIEQDADMVVMLHVPLDERTKFNHIASIGITANRSGPSCWMPADYEFQGTRQLFIEVPQYSNENRGNDVEPPQQPPEPSYTDYEESLGRAR